MSSPQIPDPAFHRWPAGSTQEYIEARRLLFEKEYNLINQIEEVASQRRALPLGPVLADYEFEEGPADLQASDEVRKVTLTDIVKGGNQAHKTLLVYHMMMDTNDTNACPACSMFIDGLNGVAKHLAHHFSLVIVAKAPISSIREYARKREWSHLRFLSSASNTFNKDMGVERPDWYKDLAQGPGFSVFRLEKGEDGGDRLRFWYHTTPHFGRVNGKEVVRGMDLLTPVWNLLDITPEGRGQWNPSHD